MDEWLKKVWVVILASIFGGTEPTKHFVILYSTQHPFFLHAYSDMDWVVMKMITPQNWCLASLSWSKSYFFRALRDKPTLLVLPQRLSTLSVDATTAELNWVCSFLIELCFTLHHSIVVYCDNVGATQLCSNLVFPSLMKRVAIDYYFIREKVQSGVFHVAHVSSADQLIDALTKPLSRPQF